MRWTDVSAKGPWKCGRGAQLISPAAAAALALAIGCGSSAEDVARSTLVTSARVVQAIDEANANAMEATREHDLEESPTREEFEARRRVYYRVEEAVRGARSFLFGAEAAVDATGAEGLVPLASCIAKAIAELRDAVLVVGELVDVDIPIPPEIDGVIDFFRTFGGQCPEEVDGG